MKNEERTHRGGAQRAIELAFWHDAAVPFVCKRSKKL